MRLLTVFVEIIVRRALEAVQRHTNIHSKEW